MCSHPPLSASLRVTKCFIYVLYLYIISFCQNFYLFSYYAQLNFISFAHWKHYGNIFCCDELKIYFRKKIHFIWHVKTILQFVAYLSQNAKHCSETHCQTYLSFSAYISCFTRNRMSLYAQIDRLMWIYPGSIFAYLNIYYSLVTVFIAELP